MAIFILFSIYVIRNYIIISNIVNTSKEYAAKTNYIANVYSPQAQDFVYDNIDAVIEYKNSKNNGK